MPAHPFLVMVYESIYTPHRLLSILASVNFAAVSLPIRCSVRVSVRPSLSICPFIYSCARSSVPPCMFQFTPCILLLIRFSTRQPFNLPFSSSCFPFLRFSARSLYSFSSIFFRQSFNLSFNPFCCPSLRSYVRSLQYHTCPFVVSVRSFLHLTAHLTVCHPGLPVLTVLFSVLVRTNPLAALSPATNALTNGGVLGGRAEPGVKSSFGSLHKLSLIGKVRACRRWAVRRDAKLWP